MRVPVNLRGMTLRRSTIVSDEGARKLAWHDTAAVSYMVFDEGASKLSPTWCPAQHHDIPIFSAIFRQQHLNSE